MSAQNGPAHRGLFYRSRTKLGGLCPAVFQGFNSMWIVRPSAITGAATELYGDLWTIQTLPCHRERHLSSYFQGLQMTTTKAELNRYFQMIDRRVPISVSQFIRWLRMPSSFAVRLVIAILLILGGIFSFLPVLGIWMLPLGLLLIAQDVPLLQKPLVAAFAGVERKCECLRVKWRDR